MSDAIKSNTPSLYVERHGCGTYYTAAEVCHLLDIAEAARAVWISRADFDWRRLEAALKRLSWSSTK